MPDCTCTHLGEDVYSTRSAGAHVQAEAAHTAMTHAARGEGIHQRVLGAAGDSRGGQ